MNTDTDPKIEVDLESYLQHLQAKWQTQNNNLRKLAETKLALHQAISLKDHLEAQMEALQQRVDQDVSEIRYLVAVLPQREDADKTMFLEEEEAAKIRYTVLSECLKEAVAANIQALGEPDLFATIDKSKQRSNV